MCGLVFLASREAIDPAALKAMGDSISHRGPDDEGFLLLGDSTASGTTMEVRPHALEGLNIGLAHRRLSILDLSALGHQPMAYKDDRYWIVYNGEIYNHLELRQELEGHGYSFRSHCDTEVILAAYDFWGAACQNRFNGMWALTIIDLHKKELFVSRDRFGIKPLYYYQNDKTFAMASEVKALLAHPDIKSEPNVKYCQRFLEAGALEYEHETAFANIYRFDFASGVTIALDAVFAPFTPTRFWDYEIDTSDEPFCPEKAQKIAADYYALLQDAIRLRLRADVPFGSALSGGLDSASIVYMIEEELKNTDSAYKQQTFSTVYSDAYKDCDESVYIKLITDTLRLKRNFIEPDVGEVPDLHTLAVGSLESPSDGLGMGGMNVYKLIDRSNVVVTLDGQGADEQQAGYLPYIVNFLCNSRLRDAYKDLKALSRIPGARKMTYIGLGLCFLRNILGGSNLERLVKGTFGTKRLRLLLPLNEVLKKDTNSALINLIHYSDARSMHYSIEARMPFMDYRLVEFTAKIPATYKIHDGWTKYFARVAFDKKLPDEICWRKDKLGWPVPHRQWFNGPLRQWLTDTINGSNFVQNHFKDSKVPDDLSTFSLDRAIRLLNLSEWHKRFFER
ncbi:asparagine synthase (glutamine-hydrolyzing) [Kordiimonas sp.]|uniref:asparagine synthase (glutamine-hydrolyzing) n=1 Tax=Kordiimonas sp. TaxID=1970157 RepID=UPI003A93B050